MDPVAITAADDDAGIDGIIVALGVEIVVSLDEAEEIFKRPKHQFEAEIVLTQVKTSEHFAKAEITNLVTACTIRDAAALMGQHGLARAENRPFGLLERTPTGRRCPRMPRVLRKRSAA